MRQESKKWARLSRILGREGGDECNSGTFSKEVVQETLLFGLETWVMKPRIRRALGGFNHRVAQCLVGINPRRDVIGRWLYLPLEAAMAATWIEEVYF